MNLSTAIQAKEIKIKWNGYEKTYIENTHRQENNYRALLVSHPPSYFLSEPRVDVYKEAKSFFKYEETLTQIKGGTIPAGTATWNFKFQLPSDLPSVFSDKHIEFDGDKIKAAISTSPSYHPSSFPIIITVYEVKVWIDMPGADIKCKENIVISETLTQRVLPITDKKIKSFAFSKGKLDFNVDIGKVRLLSLPLRTLTLA